MNESTLREKGYDIKNATITSVDLSMADHGVLTLSMGLKGDGWGCVYGCRVLGTGYVGAEKFEGNEKGIEYIMRLMDTVGVSYFNEMKDKCVRVATKGWGSRVSIIGNIIKEKWFDEEDFFTEKERTK